jgi:uncharacterized phiE125 gp8 family phage protein
MIYWPPKAPGEVEDFDFDFSLALETGETLATKNVVATGVNKDSDALESPKVLAWLSGGMLGTPGIVTCTVTTNLSRTYAETAILPIGEEPINLDMAKRQCRCEGTTGDDDYLLELISAAREHVEAYCGIRVAPAAVGMTFASFDDLASLTQAPVQSIVDVRYLDPSGVEQVLDPSVYEFGTIDADVLRPRIRLAFGKSWPALRSVDDAVRVNATVGYIAAPRPVIRAMLLLIYQWYDIRSPVQVDARGVPAEIPNSVAALLTNFRR